MKIIKHTATEFNKKFGDREFYLATDNDDFTTTGMIASITKIRMMSSEKIQENYMVKITEGDHETTQEMKRKGNSFFLIEKEYFPFLKSFSKINKLWKVTVPDGDFTVTEQYTMRKHGLKWSKFWTHRVKVLGCVCEDIYASQSYMSIISKSINITGSIIRKFDTTKLSYDDLINALTRDPVSIKFVDPKVMTDELVETALMKCPTLIKSMRNLDEKHLETAIKYRGDLITFAKDPSMELCKIASRQDKTVLKIIKTKFPEKYTEELILATLEKHGTLLQYIESPTREMCIVAVKSSYYALKSVKMQFPQFYDEKMIFEALDSNGNAIRIVDNPTVAMKFHAIKVTPLSIGGFKKQEYRYCRKAIKFDFKALKCVRKEEFTEDEYESLCIFAINISGRAIRYVKNPSRKLKHIAVSFYGFALEFIEDPDEGLIKTALHNAGKAIGYVKKPTWEMYMIALEAEHDAILSVLSKIYRNPSIDITAEQIETLCKRAIEVNPKAKESIKLFFSEMHNLKQYTDDEESEDSDSDVMSDPGDMNDFYVEGMKETNKKAKKLKKFKKVKKVHV